MTDVDRVATDSLFIISLLCLFNSYMEWSGLGGFTTKKEVSDDDDVPAADYNKGVQS